VALDEDKVSHLKLFAWGSPLVGISLLSFLVGFHIVPGLKER
jgi:hypothetical protein